MLRRFSQKFNLPRLSSSTQYTSSSSSFAAVTNQSFDGTPTPKTTTLAESMNESFATASLHQEQETAHHSGWEMHLYAPLS